MRVLLDHGSAANFGDLAMLLGIQSAYGAHPAWAVSTMPRDRLDLTRIQDLDMELLKGYEPSVDWHWLNISRIRLIRLLLRFSRRRRADFAARSCLTKLLASFDRVHFVGGGYLTSSFPNEVHEKCTLAACAVQAGCDVIFSGQQIGPWSSADHERRAEDAIAKATHIAVRDPLVSFKWASERNIPVTFSGDDSFGMQGDQKAPMKLLRSLDSAIDLLWQLISASVTIQRKYRIAWTPSPGLSRSYASA